MSDRDRDWTYWFWGYGLRGIWAQLTRSETRYEWWPMRVRSAEWRGFHAWWRGGLLNWHGIEEGREHFPFPVRNARRQVLPNPTWPGQSYERWERRICAQVWHIGPVRIVCGEWARPQDRLTDQHIREIEQVGRSVVG